MCGDDYSDAVPRLHELGGVYGSGVIVETYLQGSLIKACVEITANHLGYMRFDLCNLEKNDGRESEECFKPVYLADGSKEYYLPSNKPGLYNVTLRLPKRIVGRHCVLRWTYVTGNSWGICPDGQGAMGCGNLFFLTDQF